jgi:phosphonate transport system substrate-binding protein
VVFNTSTGYQAIAKERDKQIKGIIVVPKNSEISRLTDLQNTVLAFPAPAAFAATILTQADLAAQQVSFTPDYVSSHDSVYRSVAKGIYPAGGGVLRTFNNLAPQIREQLRILWTTDGYTPHAIAVHPRITVEDTLKLQRALLNMDQDAAGKQLLESININGFENGVDADWDDIRDLQLKLFSKD